MPYLQFISAVQGLFCWLRDTFTGADGTVIDTHVPEKKVGDFAWYGTAEITSNRIYGPVSGASIQGYKSAYTALGVEPPFKITLVALCTATGGEYCGTTFENDDNTTNIVVELGGAGALTVTVLDAVTEVNDIATGLALDTEHTIEVIFEAQRFQTIVNGTPRSAVDFGGDIPVDMVAVTPAIASADSYISSIAVCATEDEITASEAALLLHFEGADGETNIVDSSVHGWTMTGHDACKISTNKSKWGGSSLRLARAADNEGLLAISASAELAHAGNVPWWVDFWIYPVTCNSPNSIQPFYFISDDGGPSGSAYTAGIQVIRSGLNFFSGMHWQSSSEGSLPAFPQNVWTHIAVGNDGTTLRRFVNGVLAASATTSIPEASSSGTFYVGGAPTGSNTTSDGITEIYIDELRFLLGSCPYTSDFTPPTGPYT